MSLHPCNDLLWGRQKPYMSIRLANRSNAVEPAFYSWQARSMKHFSFWCRAPITLPRW